MNEQFKHLDEIEDLKTYISVEENLPDKDGVYDTIMHCGSMSVYFRKTENMFRKGRFQKFDWDYVVYWKRLA